VNAIHFAEVRFANSVQLNMSARLKRFSNVDLELAPDTALSEMVIGSTSEKTAHATDEARSQSPRKESIPIRSRLDGILAGDETTLSMLRIHFSCSKRPSNAHSPQDESQYETAAPKTQDSYPAKYPAKRGAVTARTETKVKLRPGDVREMAADSTLVLPEDHWLVPDSLFIAMGQLEVCHVKEEDQYRLYKHTKVVGYVGLQCKHCTGHGNGGRYFPPSVSDLIHGTSRRILAHTKNCQSSPASVRDAFLAFRNKEATEQQQSVGSVNSRDRKKRKRFFFQRIWMRLHGDQELLEDNELSDDLEFTMSAPLRSTRAGTGDHEKNLSEQKTYANSADPLSSTSVAKTQQKPDKAATETLCVAVNSSRKDLAVRTVPSFAADSLDNTPAKEPPINTMSAFQWSPCNKRRFSAISQETSHHEASLPQSTIEEALVDDAQTNITVFHAPETVWRAADIRGEMMERIRPSDFSELINGSTIVFPEDRGLVPDSMVVAFGQLEVCHVKEEDCFGRYQATRVVGYTGVQCKHCGGGRTAGRFFPPTLDGLTYFTTRRILLHVENCSACPKSIQDAFLRFRRCEAAEPPSVFYPKTKTGKGYRGSPEGLRRLQSKERLQRQKTFFRRVWCRLHGESADVGPRRRRQSTRTFELASSSTSPPSALGYRHQHEMQRTSSATSTTTVSIPYSCKAGNRENPPAPLATQACPGTVTTASAPYSPMILNGPCRDRGGTREEQSPSAVNAATPDAVDEQLETLRLVPLQQNTHQFAPFHSHQTFISSSIPQSIPGPSMSYLVCPNPGMAVNPTFWQQPSITSEPSRQCVYVLAPIPTGDNALTDFVGGPVAASYASEAAAESGLPSMLLNREHDPRFIAASEDSSMSAIIQSRGAQADEVPQDSNAVEQCHLQSSHQLDQYPDHHQYAFNDSRHVSIPVSGTLASSDHNHNMSPSQQLTAVPTYRDTQQAPQHQHLPLPPGQGPGFLYSQPTIYPAVAALPFTVHYGHTQQQHHHQQQQQQQQQQWVMPPTQTYLLIVPPPNGPTEYVMADSVATADRHGQSAR
jgi:hypothetical protein